MTNYLHYFYDKAIRLNEVRKPKTLVFMLSSMRSGSTLFKSLLANAPDTSHLPEINFQKYSARTAWKLKGISSAKIIVLKKPAPFHDPHYPQIPPFVKSKNLILVRDPYDTILSLKKMITSAYPEVNNVWTYEKLAHDYWYPTYSNILKTVDVNTPNTLLVKYEDLIHHPIDTTRTAFAFIGSKQTEGVDHYLPPQNHQWGWGKDDGGQKIQSLKVQASPVNRDNEELLNVINNSEKLHSLLLQLGYDT